MENDAAVTSIKATKGYSTTASGQVHWRCWEPAELDQATASPDLYCLHPAPFSGLAYQNLGPRLARMGRVFAPDYPGYGGSDAASGQPAIGDYADTLIAMVDQLSAGREVRLLGFHTGCLVAAEIALRRPDGVQDLCLIDVPAFPTEVARQYSDAMSKPVVITQEIESIEGAWKATMPSRIAAQGEEQALAMLAERLRAGTEVNAAFLAAFAYPWKERLPLLECKTWVMATQSSLLDYTLDAAQLIPQATLVERRDITASVLDASADEVAEQLLAYLS